MLTGKCKKDYETWFYEKYLASTDIPDDAFKYIDFSMEYGVLVDFFNSVGIHITVGIYGYTLNFRDLTINDKYNIKTRHEARTEAIKKANEIYNESK